MDLHRLTSLTIRVLQLGIFLLLSVWIFGYLGGLSFAPVVRDPADPTTNDTSTVFNWHPLLMMLAFVGCMTEAIMTYSTTGSSWSFHIPESNRPLKKIVHGVLHGVALVLSLLGILAAIRSHTMKLPSPMPNFYTTHSYLGVLTVCMMVAQMTVGILAYVAPQWSLPARQAFSPIHRFFGGATFVVGMATVMVGVQEKTTFLQLVQHPGVRGGIMQVPAFLQVVLAVFMVAVGLQVVVWRLVGGVVEHGEEHVRFRSVVDHEIALE
jgi:cytochrome b-561